MFPSPRPQPDRDTNDTIVDRMDEIHCSEGGSASGRSLIRIANMAFRSERAVIARKLVELKRQGCDVEVIVSNADGDILAGLVSAGIPVHPFFLRAITGARPQVIVHSKFWLVDAGSDGHSPMAGGLKRLHVEMSGAQTGAWDFAGETNG